MRFTSFFAALGAIVALALPPLVHAGDGHDHGGGAPAATGPALPRFAAVSEDFELVGVVNGKLLTLYLDRTIDNAPVTDAQIELDIAGVKYKAERHDDAFEVTLAAALKPGVLPITATVTAGKEVDLLAGELDLHEEARAAAAHTHSWTEYARWAVAALAAFALLFFVGRRFTANRSRRAGVAA
jgi:hypothetical protein